MVCCGRGSRINLTPPQFLVIHLYDGFSFQYVCSPCCEGFESLGGMKPNWCRIGVAERTRWFIIMLCFALLCFP